MKLLAVLLWALRIAVTASPTKPHASSPHSPVAAIKPSHTTTTSKPVLSPTKSSATPPSKPKALSKPTKPAKQSTPIKPTTASKPSTPVKPTTASKPTAPLKPTASKPKPRTTPTNKPVKKPTVPSKPVALKPISPSSGFVNLAPFSKLFSIKTDKLSYAFNSTVTVSYTSLQPRRDDFIGLFQISTPTSNLTKGFFWLWTCNQQGNVCSSAKGKGSVEFGPKGPPSAWSIHWPLPAGQYRAYLLRDSAGPPYTAIAQSEVFTVVQTFDEALAGAKATITALVLNNTNLVPQFLRLIFHDCIGGCDGCIDLANLDNSGIASAINTLKIVTDAFANNSTGLSRADVWSMAAIVAADVVNKGNHRKPIHFTFDWFGRVNCEDANKKCFNASKQEVPCAPTAGPHRDIPSPNLNTTGLFSFFKQVYGFSPEQAVAAMGAHSVGRLFREDIGIDGPDGWEINNQQLHSEYYEALLGSATAKSNASDILAKSPKWDHIFLNNKKFDRPNRFFWRLNVAGKNLTMLNTDVGMVRDLNNKNTNPVTGEVSCAFNPTLGETPLCPLAETVTFAQKFLDNDVWLAEFKSVLDLISTNEYIRKNCTKPPCRLIRKTTP